MTDPDHRMTELEIALTHQQAMLDELSGVVRDQDARIDTLLLRLDRLARRIEEADAAQGSEPDADARPPHW